MPQPDHLDRAELTADLSVQRRDYQFRIGISPNPDEDVYLIGNFNAGDEDPNAGWEREHQMNVTGNFATVTIPHLVIGQSYEYKLRYRNRATGAIRDVPREAGNNRKITIPKAPEASPSPVLSVAQIAQNLKGRVADIVTGAQTNPESLEAQFERLESDIDALDIRQNITPLILGLAAEVIRDSDSVPQATRQRFSKSYPPPTSFDDISRRIMEGSAIYRRSVFAEIKKNEAARKLFRLKPNSPFRLDDPLGNRHFNELFNRLCASHDLLPLISKLGLAIGSVANVPARNERLTEERRALLAGVVKQLTPREPTLVERVPVSWKSRALSAVIQGGCYLGAYAISPWLLAGLGAKYGLESLVGVNERDILDALRRGDWKEFKSIMGSNNIITRLVRDKEHRGELLKGRFTRFLAGFIPGSSVVLGGRAVGPERENVPADHDEMMAEAERLIIEASEKALK